MRSAYLFLIATALFALSVAAVCSCLRDRPAEAIRAGEIPHAGWSTEPSSPKATYELGGQKFENPRKEEP